VLPCEGFSDGLHQGWPTGQAHEQRRAMDADQSSEYLNDAHAADRAGDVDGQASRVNSSTTDKHLIC
jgi:hypothetical protein